LKTYHNVINDLENHLKAIEEKHQDILIKTEEAVKICKFVLQQLQELVSNNTFNSQSEEIEFFKTIKPNVVSKLIYYIEYFNIQSKKPKGIKKLQIKYLNEQILKLQEYYNLNMEFCHYYLKKDTNLDKQYFLRRNKKVRLNIESYHFFTDQNFSTSHDHTVATIMAYENLISQLHTDINNLKTINMDTTTANKAFHEHHNLHWTATKTDLIELIYAIHSSGAINNGNVDIKDIAITFQELFNIELGDYYRAFLAMRIRKTGRTKFMHTLTEQLEKYMDDCDEKA